MKMIESKHYTQDFYDEQQNGSLVSAKRVLPLVKSLFNPSSVIDVGCGVGYWLKVWKEDLGVSDILGIEGPYVSPDMLKIPRETVQFQDLKNAFHLNRKFDLAMSLEVAEHLPKEHAEEFIESLTIASDIILFSAAIVGQEGTYHINEQMPEYWAKIFAQYSYVPVDYIRPKIWTDERIEWWYRQNIIIYVRRERLKDFPALNDSYRSTSPDYLLRVQPWLYFYKQDHIVKTQSIVGYLRWKLHPLKKLFRKK
jgi:SAM-dependent methyltransferase